VRCRGLRGLGGCWRRVDERMQEDEKPITGLRGGGMRLIRKGIRRYVRARITGTNSRSRGASISNPQRTSTEPTNHPTVFRYARALSRIEDVPSLVLEMPDFELWINELWHDFLIEPTPYLVASAILYLGSVLLLAQYYEAVWRLCSFFFHFIPYDDELSLRYI
jgi:hypothetical protein